MDVTGKRGVDAVIELDLTANAKLIPSVLRPKGTVVVYGTGPEAVLPSAFCLVNSVRLQFFLVYELDAKERESAISGINDALKSGTLINRLARPTFSLAQTAAAHEAVENGSIGNVVLAF
jgi:NADPH2:quinone reductase